MWALSGLTGEHWLKGIPPSGRSLYHGPQQARCTGGLISLPFARRRRLLL